MTSKPGKKKSTKEFRGLWKMDAVNMHMKEVDKITKKLIQTLVKTTTKNYSPHNIWFLLNDLILEFEQLESKLIPIVKKLKKI